MLSKKQVCDQLSSMYSDFGVCDINLAVEWDQENNAWLVDFEHNNNRIRHYLENEDAEACVIQHQCVGMGIEFGQFR